MNKFGYVIGTAIITAAALTLAVVGLSATAHNQHSPKSAMDASKPHRLVLQVNIDDADTMNLALNNATNVARYYQDLGEDVQVEVITFGGGLHMLRADTSPVKERIKRIVDNIPSISFKACGNTRDNMSRAEKKTIPLIPEATVVKSGVVRVMELQEQGWSYVRP